MVIAMVALAALSFSIAGCFMKLSNGFTVLGPTAFVFALVIFGTSLQAFAMRNEQMIVIYVMVLGLEAITAYFLGAFFLKESTSFVKLAGMCLILTGILFLRFSPT